MRLSSAIAASHDTTVLRDQRGELVHASARARRGSQAAVVKDCPGVTIECVQLAAIEIPNDRICVASAIGRNRRALCGVAADEGSAPGD